MDGVSPCWEHFAHDADIGVRGTGASREQAFEQAALAMTAVIAEPELVRATRDIVVECSANGDDDLLLVDWLNALVYEMATRKMLFSRFSVKFEGTRLVATASGEAVDPQRHRPAAEVKGATLTELKVEEQPNGSWIAQCVVDV